MSLFRDHMNSNRTRRNLANLLEVADKGGQIMSVDRPHVLEPHLFEKHARNKQMFCQLFHAADEMNHRRTERQFAENILDIRFEMIVAASRNDPRQVRGNRSHAF